MRLLFDQNLSARLADALADVFPGSTHVRLVGLDAATDRRIWDYAGAHGFVVVSKDSDFRTLANNLGPPPTAIVLEIGNSSTDFVLDLLRANVRIIEEFDRGDGSLLVISTH